MHIVLKKEMYKYENKNVFLRLVCEGWTEITIKFNVPLYFTNSNIPSRSGFIIVMAAPRQDEHILAVKLIVNLFMYFHYVRCIIYDLQT